MRKSHVSPRGLSQVFCGAQAHLSPAFVPGHDPAVMEKKMLAFVSMVSMVAALGALAWALGRSSESLIATHPAVMAAAAHR